MELSRVHDYYLWTDKPSMISKEVIREVTRLFSTGPVPILKFVKNKDVMELTGATFNHRALMVDTIQNLVVRYTVMVIG